jgi:hypothetical protein
MSCTQGAFCVQNASGTICHRRCRCLAAARESIRWLGPHIGANAHAAHHCVQLVIAQRISSAPPEHIFYWHPSCDWSG